MRRYNTWYSDFERGLYFLVRSKLYARIFSYLMFSRPQDKPDTWYGTVRTAVSTLRYYSRARESLGHLSLDISGFHAWNLVSCHVPRVFNFTQVADSAFNAAAAAAAAAVCGTSIFRPERVYIGCTITGDVLSQRRSLIASITKHMKSNSGCVSQAESMAGQNANSSAHYCCERKTVA